MNAAEPSAFRIYVVDDDPMIADLVSQILHMDGFEAVSFVDPELLLSHCEVLPPNLVISDVIMPQMDGFELARRLNLAYPECGVILFTGHAGAAELRNLAMEEGQDLEVLSKPIHPRELIAKVRGFAGILDKG